MMFLTLSDSEKRALRSNRCLFITDNPSEAQSHSKTQEALAEIIPVAAFDGASDSVSSRSKQEGVIEGER